jgi:hypothetical protein
MSRKTVRVDIPNGSPDDLITLGQNIMAKHTKDGAASPLDATKMTALSAALGTAATQNQAAKDADAVAQAARQTRDTALGVADGQTATTKNTGLNLITYARDQLLIENEGTEEALQAYGFNVVVGSAKMPAARASAKSGATARASA